MAALPQLFGVIPTGSPIITTPTSAPSPTSLLFNLSICSRPFSHIVVFLLPGTTLPANTAAAVYLAIPSPSPTFRFLGGIGPGKESAIFKVNGLGSATNTNNANAEIDMDAPEGQGQELLLGVSLESAASVAAQMAVLQAARPSSIIAESGSVILSPPEQKPDALVLAQRIIKNAFNFLASFSGNVNGGVEVIPLKAFEDWWRKFEGRVRSDPGFLEKDVE